MLYGYRYRVYEYMKSNRNRHTLHLLFGDVANTIISLKSSILMKSFEACKSRADAWLGFKRRLIRKLRRCGGY